jgi:glycosidase
MKRPLRIIEISIPHATAEGTLKAAMDLPDQIASYGFNTVFILPWMKVDLNLSRSPYAITDYTQLNERVGVIKDAQNWIARCRQAGLNVVLDMPLNHTSPNHPWTSNTGWYALDKDGNKCSPAATSWTDVVQLNHSEPLVCDAGEKVLRFWLELGVGGFRFDAASFILDTVLQKWIDELKKIANHELLLWCDGEEYFNSHPIFNGFLHHEAFRLAKNNVLEWESLVKNTASKGIFYLTNHDTLHLGKSPFDEWLGSYRLMREILESSSQNTLFSWSDWQNPSGSYSFML